MRTRPLLSAGRSVQRSYIGLVIFAVSVALFGCGDGGGDSDADMAVITMTNAAKLLDNVVGGVAQSGGTEAPNLARELSGHLRSALSQATPALSPGSRQIAAIDVTDPGICISGLLDIIGPLDDDGTGTLTFDYIDCRLGDVRDRPNVWLNGRVTVRVDAFDLDYFATTDAMVSFSSLGLRVGDWYSLSGSFRLQNKISTNTETLIVNVVTRDDATDDTSRTEDLVMVNVYDDILAPSSFTMDLTGHVFDSVHGYVEVTTSVPLAFETLRYGMEIFPHSGQLLLVGAGNASVRSTAVLPIPPAYTAYAVMLELDLDGDSIHEHVATIPYAELSEEAGSNLADSDGDGMHDSWELVYDLDPLDPTDAHEDPDQDHVTNIEEYLRGWNPLVK